ncbi:MAG: hypothetical protein KF819_10610 [Labilithrix sp.]|nr:hypothetical protein [Labilithrix sp.]
MIGPDAIPPRPPARDSGQDGGVAELRPRYEDVAQDGSIQPTALMHGIGHAVWRSLVMKNPAIEVFRAKGILPILRRLVIVVDRRSVSVNVPIRYEGAYRFAREKGGDRLFVNMWVEASAPISNTFLPTPRDAPFERLGRIFAEHVISRPFEPPDRRKVTRLEGGPGVPEIPEDEHVFEPAEALLRDRALDDLGAISFGMMHTDSNQHVNSLVYPRVFEEALVQRLAETGRDYKALLANAVEIRWRKPFFSGERAQIRAAMLEAPAGSPWTVGAAGAFFGAGDKPNSTIQTWLA